MELLGNDNQNRMGGVATKAIEKRARNLKLFYWKMLGYPGVSLAKDLINHFCHYHKFTFGKYKGECIGEIMMTDFQYIKWCIDNCPIFKMNEEENALYNTSWKYSVGGYIDEFIYGCYTDTYTKEGDTYDKDLIDEEIELMEREKEL